MSFMYPAETTPQLLYGRSARPTLTQLALLVKADPAVAAVLIRDPIAAATAHPFHKLHLDARDCEILLSIHARVHTVAQFLDCLADVVDGVE